MEFPLSALVKIISGLLIMNFFVMAKAVVFSDQALSCNCRYF